VHDARPQHAAYPAEIPDVVQQRVDERAAAVARRRVHDHPGRLVEHDEVGILEHDPEWQRLRLGAERDRLGDLDGVGLPAVHGCARPEGSRRSLDAAVLDQALDPGSRVLRQHAGKEAIETKAVLVGLHLHRSAAGFRAHTAASGSTPYV
jgi:hypothetical protein